MKLSTNAWIGIGVLAGVGGYFLWSSRSAIAAAPVQPAKTITTSKPTGGGGGMISKPKPVVTKTVTTDTPSMTDASSSSDVTDGDKNEAYQSGLSDGKDAASLDAPDGASTHSNPPGLPSGNVSSGKPIAYNAQLTSSYQDGFHAGYDAGIAAYAASKLAGAITSGIPRMTGAYHPSLYGYSQGIYGRRQFG